MTRQSINSRPLSAVGIDALQFRYFSMGLGISIAVHALCVIGLSLLDFPMDTLKFPPKPPIWVDPSPPRWVLPPIVPSAPGHSTSRSGEVGIPIPAPEVPIETTIPTQDEMNPGVGIPGEGGEEVTVGAGGFGSSGEPADPRPDEGFILVEKNPMIVRSAVPKYPELALRAGLEGRVWLKIWVDREGKPREVRLTKSDNDIFNDAAIEAAKQFLFTPAVMNNGPVSVWVSLPFKFTLKAQ